MPSAITKESRKMPCAECSPVSGTEERVMREDLLNELTAEYEEQRARNDREENARRDRIRRDFPDIEKLVLEREGLVFGTIRKILDGNAGAENLTEKMQALNTEIGNMLLEKGLPADYLSPVYKCIKCKSYKNDLYIKYQILLFNIKRNELFLTKMSEFKLLPPNRLYKELMYNLTSQKNWEINIDNIIKQNQINLMNYIFYFSIEGLSFDFLLPKK